MPISINNFSAHDQQIWDEELQDFVPDRVFDVTCHLPASFLPRNC